MRILILIARRLGHVHGPSMASDQRYLSSLAMRRNREASGFKPANVHNAETRAVENCRPETWEAIRKIHKLGWSGQWRDVIDEFEGAEEKATILYNATLAAADRCKRYDEGLALFQQMRAAGVVLTGVSYASALTLLGRQGRYAEAKALWEELRQARVSPTPACLTGLLNAAAASGDVAEVRRLLAEAEADGWELGAGHITCLARAARDALLPATALEALRELSSRGLRTNAVPYTVAVAAGTRALQADQLTLPQLHEHLRIVKEEMQASLVETDPYFVEQELRVLLGGGDLSQWTAEGGMRPQPEALVAGREALEAAAARGLRRTRLVQRVEDWLYVTERCWEGSDSRRSEAVLPAGWHQTLDPASGQTYYWYARDPAGTTTWTRPA